MSIQDFNLRDYLRHLSLPFSEAGESKSVTRGWVGIACAFCGDPKDHLGINLAFKNYHCWKCRASGSLVRLIQELEGLHYGDALDRLDDFQSPIPGEAVTSEDLRERLTDRGQDILPLGCGRLTGIARSYLRNARGFDPDVLQDTWGLLSGPLHGPWKHRIIIPIRLRGRVMTWVGLDPVGEMKVKYKAASLEESLMPASELVYGADYVGRNVLIVEGVTDAWRMGPGAVAMLGMGVTPEKVAALRALDAENYYIMLDGEDDARRNADILGFTLASYGLNVEILGLEDGDPADLPVQEARTWASELELGT